MTLWSDVEMLLQVGEYRRGVDAESDEAIDKHAAIDAFLKQDTRRAAPPAETIAELYALATPPAPTQAVSS